MAFDLARRLGVEVQEVERFGLSRDGVLRDPDALIDEALALGPTDPRGATTLLAAAILSAAQRIPDRGHALVLATLAPLVAKSDPMIVLGPGGAPARARVMPNGWRHTLGEWERLAYAWREGMAELLILKDSDAPIINALDEATRLRAADPVPTRVILKERSPTEGLALAVSMLGIGLSVYNLARERELRAREARIERIARQRQG